MKINPNSFPSDFQNPEEDLQSKLETELEKKLEHKLGIQADSKPNATDFIQNTPLNAVAGNELSAAQSLLGLRGASKAQQTQMFGLMSLQAAEVALSSIFGAPVKFALDALAGTGEGKRVVKAVGHTLEQTYEAQKALFKGDVGGVVHAFEGGSSHAQRESKFFAAVTARIQELQTKGGTLTAQDVAGFKQAIAYGDIHPLGTEPLDLIKLDLAIGTNPFGPVEGTSAADLASRTALK